MSDDFEPTYDNCDEVTDRCPIEATVYGTDLSKGAAVFFGIAFLICLLSQVYLGARARTWAFSIWLALGTILEGIGYLARYDLAKNPWELNSFIINYIALLLAPTLVAAAISVTFKSIALWYGRQYSLLRPSLYPWVFVGTDFLSIFIQIIGGGAMAAASTGNGNKTIEKLGEGLVIGGVVFQVVNMICCGGLMLTLARRRKKAMGTGMYSMGGPDQPGFGSGEIRKRGNTPMSRTLATEKEAKRARIFIYALAAAYIVILIRCAYRIAENAPAIRGDVLRNEPLFLALDGGMMLLGIGIVTFCHPFMFFPYLGVRSKYIKDFEQSDTLPMSNANHPPAQPPVYPQQPYHPGSFQQPPPPQQQPYPPQQTGPHYGYTN